MSPDPGPAESAAAVPSRGARPEAALAGTMLAWTLLVVLVVTLAPFEFRLPLEVHVAWTGSPEEFAANCALLVVPGFLFRTRTGATRDRWCIAPLAVGAAISIAVEAAQTTVPGRFVSPIDVFTNAAGFWFGATLHDAARRHLDERAADRLLLELPLMGIVYLLVPLLWLGGLTAGEDPLRLAATFPLGVMGGGVLAAVWHHRLRESGVLSPTGIALVAGAWFLAAAAPALRHDPTLLVAETLAVAAATRLLAVWPWFLRADGARFEIPTLRRLGGLFVLHLTLLAGWPWREPAAEFQAVVLIPELGVPPRLGPLLNLVEYLAAFTLGGYVVAESRGRREEPLARTLLWTVVPYAGFAVALELLRGYHPEHGASLVRPLLGVVGAGYGAAIYREQASAVRRWIAARKARAGGLRPEARASA